MDTDFGVSLRRHSRFRYLSGKRWKESEKHENVSVGTGKNLSSRIKTNGKYFTVPFNSRGFFDFFNLLFTLKKEGYWHFQKIIISIAGKQNQKL